jgi:hypothetical protein
MVLAVKSRGPPKGVAGLQPPKHPKTEILERQIL